MPTTSPSYSHHTISADPKFAAPSSSGEISADSTKRASNPATQIPQSPPINFVQSLAAPIPQSPSRNSLDSIRETPSILVQIESPPTNPISPENPIISIPSVLPLPDCPPTIGSDDAPSSASLSHHTDELTPITVSTSPISLPPVPLPPSPALRRSTWPTAPPPKLKDFVWTQIMRPAPNLSSSSFLDSQKSLMQRQLSIQNGKQQCNLKSKLSKITIHGHLPLYRQGRSLLDVAGSLRSNTVLMGRLSATKHGWLPKVSHRWKIYA